MRKNASDDLPETTVTVDDFARNRQKSLVIKQIRAYVDQLRTQPDDAPMPDWSHLTIGDRFAILLRMIPSDQRERLLGKSQGHIRRYETGLDIPLTVVAALAAETMTPLEWIVSGKAMDRLAPVVYVTRDAPQADAEDVPVKKLAFRVAAGRGNLILDESAKYVRFPRRILADVGVSPPHARLWEASGESMKPTINDGDTILVDVSNSASEIIEGKIYVFSMGNDAYVKRLRRIGDRLILISDNSELFPPEEASGPVKVFGRVKWAGRAL